MTREEFRASNIAVGDRVKILLDGKRFTATVSFITTHYVQVISNHYEKPWPVYYREIIGRQ